MSAAEAAGSKRGRKKGLSPGTLVHVGERRMASPRITVIDYDGEKFLEKTVQNIDECFPFHETATVTWINVDGVHDPQIVEKLGHAFSIHQLILEDIMTTSQRPKIEDLGESLYIVLRMIQFKKGGQEIETEQLSLAFGRNFVLTFQEEAGDMFDNVRERIRHGKGRIRKLAPDYLAYALIDAVVDHYFVILERLGDRIEALEDELVGDPSRATLTSIHKLKREMLFIRKAVWPLREVVANLQRTDSPLIHETTGIFLRDVYDHIIQVIDSVETFREMLSGMLETYLSSVSNRMNEVMKTLTIIATIFIPLTFIVGIYGMNFEHMPEIKWRFGYFLIWGIMIAIGGGMVAFFRRRKWF